MFNNKHLTPEEWNKQYEKRFEKKSRTTFVELKDSLNFYFRLITHINTDNWATLTNGGMSITAYNKDRTVVKEKYGMRDTLISFSSEGGSSYATLTNEKGIFEYLADSYLIRIAL